MHLVAAPRACGVIPRCKRTTLQLWELRCCRERLRVPRTRHETALAGPNSATEANPEVPTRLQAGHELEKRGLPLCCLKPSWRASKSAAS